MRTGDYCFGCLPKRLSATHVRRRVCVSRQYHRPAGQVVPHDHVPHPMHTCRDCGTLVVKV